jgi:S-DNA-T family DNA segregation ATPase FtsK/SpoIIIE
VKGKALFSLILSTLLFLASALFVTYLLVDSATFSFIPLHSYIEKGITFLQQEGTLALLAPTQRIFILPSFFLFFALFFVITRRASQFWWMFPYSVLFYYSLYIFFQLRSSSPYPEYVMKRLLAEPVMAQVLMILLLLLEMTIFLLFTIISVKLYRRSRAKQKQMNAKTPPKKVKKRSAKKKSPIVEQDEPIMSKSEDLKEAKEKLSFPSIESLPDLKTLSFPSSSQSDMYVGKVSEQPDNSFVLTDTPIEHIESEIVSPEKKRPFEALRNQLKKDQEIVNFKIPTSMPTYPTKEVKIESEVVEPKVEIVSPVVPTYKNPVQQPVVAEDTPEQKEVVEETSSNEDDIDYVSGVGGLVGNSLLSRNKIAYHKPSPDLLDTYPNHTSDIDQPIIDAGERLIETLRQFKIEATVSAIVKGPTVTMYELTLAPGVRVSSISNLADNIAMELAARTVRIVAPIPGKQAVGIEVPNDKRSIIGFKDLLSTVDPIKVPHLPMILGRKITGEPVVMDLTRTPHLLIAGATGSGKSVCVNSLINSLLYTKSPKEVRLILVDPKIVELRIYNGIPHLLTPVITEPKKTIKALEYCLYEMDRRYKLLNNLAVRNISAYNAKLASQKIAREKLPYIVVVIDEFADIMTTVGKELETLLARLAAMARAVGIHLVLATQRPSADVITGIIKSNIPTRIAFTVSGQVNSRIIIDETGAEKLLGGGDMLFAPGWEPNSTRLQGAFLSDDEVERVVAYVKTQGESDYLDEAFFEDEQESSSNGDDEFDEGSDEALRGKAIKIIIERNGASASYLQRRLRIGYNKAARLIEQLEDEGIVGPSRGSKPRELLRMPD